MPRIVVDLDDDAHGYLTALAAVRGVTPADLLAECLHRLPVGWTERREVNEWRLRQRALSVRKPRADAPAWLRGAQ